MVLWFSMAGGVGLNVKSRTGIGVRCLPNEGSAERSCRLVPSSQSQRQRKGVRARALEQAVAAMARARVASESVRVKAARDHLVQAGVTLD